MRFIIIRHGRTISNEEKRYSIDETELADSAYADLDKLRTKLNSFKYENVYVSPLKRTIQTAQYLGLKNFITDERIKELDFGVFKGLTFKEAEKLYPKEIKLWIEDKENQAPPEGESSEEHFIRVSSFLNEMAKKGKDVLIVAHYGTIIMSLAWALGSLAYAFKFVPENSSITVLRAEKGIKIIEAFNI